MASKIPNCMGSEVEAEEILQIRHESSICYSEVTVPYAIKKNLSPVISFDESLTFSISTPRSEVYQKDFPIFSMSCDSLVRISVEILLDTGLNPSKLLRFFDCVSKNYYQHVPFHNFWHGFSVMQLIFVIRERNSKFRQFLNEEDYLCLMLGAIGHDICHPGINNAYLQATNHEISTKYSHVSALENHHSAVILQIIKASGLFNDTYFDQMKECVIEEILSTDMARHKVCCENFQDIMKNYDNKNKSHRQKFCNYVMHCSDLGNQTLEFSIAKIWSLKIIREFNQQVKCESDNGISVSEFMRVGSDITKIKNSQTGFIKSIILPLWTELSLHLENIEDFVETLKINKKKWEEIQNFEDSV